MNIDQYYDGFFSTHSGVLDKIAGENGEEAIQAERAERFYTLYFRKILL